MTLSLRSLASATALVTALVTLSPGVVAEAAGPAKKAIKALNKSRDQLAKSLKNDLAIERGILFAKLASIDSTLKGGTGSLSDTTTLFDDLMDYQAAVQSVANGHITEAKDAVLQATVVLDDAGFTSVDYPKDLRFGEGGALDRLYEDLRKEMQTALKKTRKQVAKTVQLFEKKANVGVICQLDVPSRMIPYATGADQYSGKFQAIPTTIDVLITASDLGQAGDGRVLAGGDGWWNPGTEVRIFSSGSPYPQANQTTSRWDISFFSEDEGPGQIVAYPNAVFSVHGPAKAYSIR